MCTDSTLYTYVIEREKEMGTGGGIRGSGEEGKWKEKNISLLSVYV